MRPRALDFEAGFTVYPVAMEGLRVSQLAESAGVPASTVRYYERVGLLSPARRAGNGYRLFDHSSLDELAFINRAKGIGMSLEIAELLAVWPDTECRDLQDRLSRYLAGRIDQVRMQQRELEAFEAQLRAVRGRLAGREADADRCSKGCSCEADLDLTGDGPTGEWAGGECSLDDESRIARMAEWRILAEEATSVCRNGDAVRLTFAADPEVVAYVARLCAEESDCCAPVRFRLDIGADGFAVSGHAPGARSILEALFPERPRVYPWPSEA
jgi:MerR family transcriptional regulator, copper efflux regulator